MGKRLRGNAKFLVSFLVFSGVLLVAWPYVFIGYLYLLIPVADAVWHIVGYPVQLVIHHQTLHMVYHQVAAEPLSFSVHDVDEIYLNLPLLLALFGGTWVAMPVKTLRPVFVPLGILYGAHQCMLFAYSYSHIWTWIDTQPAPVRDRLLPHVAAHFSQNTADWCSHVLFHYNTWGWDVLPLLLWLVGIWRYVELPVLTGAIRRRSAHTRT